MKIKYKSAVMVAAGWRSVVITAEVKPVSVKRAEVAKVLEIDGKAPTGYTSRTGANRQKYNAAAIAAREVGKVKILSKCFVIAETEEAKP